MATSIYLGMPPANVVRWIEENVKTGPIFKDETQVVYTDGTTWEGLIEGDLYYGTIPNQDIIKELVIGNKVTYIDFGTFAGNVSLTTVYIPDNIPNISPGVFSSCESLKSFPNSTTEQVNQWFNDGVLGYGTNTDETGTIDLIITCKDGIISAIGKWDGQSGTGWDITITPL